MKVTVLIPTYHNPRKLLCCIDSLTKQSHLPHEVVVLCEKSDKETLRKLADYSGALNLILVKLHNMEQMSCSLNEGISKASGEIVAFLDEDIIAKEDWIERLIAEFKDDGIAACGGKDVVTMQGRRVQNTPVDDVGILKWKGYIIGNQHRGSRRKRVTFLKGCNMAIRSSLLNGLDENLLGRVRWEQDIFLNIQRGRGRVIYDPAIMVFHCKDALQFHSALHTFWFGHNTIYLFLKHLYGRSRPLAVLFSFLLGDASSPGLLRFIPWIVIRNDQALCSFCTSVIGKLKGIGTYLSTHGRNR